jgi:hypothetical protein
MWSVFEGKRQAISLRYNKDIGLNFLGQQRTLKVSSASVALRSA